MNKLNEVKKSLNKMTGRDVNDLLIRSKATKGLEDTLKENVKQKEDLRKFRDKKWDTVDALEETVVGIIKTGGDDKQKQLETAFDDFKNIMISSIMESEEAIKEESEDKGGVPL